MWPRLTSNWQSCLSHLRAEITGMYYHTETYLKINIDFFNHSGIGLMLGKQGICNLVQCFKINA